MPYFAWKGVNLHAKICKGTHFAQNKDSLDAILLKKDIALLSCYPKKLRWKRKISLSSKIDYLVQIALLMKAGMLLPKALRLVANQINQPHFALATHSIADEVEHGTNFSQALQKHPKIFKPFVTQMAFVGQESGSLPESLQVLTTHLESLAQFKRKLMSALLLPIITFLFFLTIIFIMLIVIVPQFASIFAAMQKDLPWVTVIMLKMSNFLRSGNLVYCTLAFLGFVCGFIGYFKTNAGKKSFDKFLIVCPFIKSLIIIQTMTGFFQAVAMLLQGGMPLVKAVYIAKEAIGNSYIKDSMENVVQEMNAGIHFADTLAQFEQLCPPATTSLIKIGQESNQLSPLLLRIVAQYQQQLIQKLSRINTLIQPFLLIILGFMITGLILAIYAPIMNLSSGI